MKIDTRLLLLLLFFAACRKLPAISFPIAPVEALQKNDVAYGTDARQTMDLDFIADRSDTTPLAVLIHGGGWSAGDKKDLKGTENYFVSRGINVININYRLTDTGSHSVRAPDLLQDVGNAIKMLHANAGIWHVRSSGYVPYGFSAGAHLALWYSYSYDKENLIPAVIGLGTPTKFDDPKWQTNPYIFVAYTDLPPLTGEPWASHAEDSLLRDYSPYYQSSFKPTFLLYGDKDQVVPPSQSGLMMSKLNETGTTAAFFPLPNGSHDGDGASQADIDSAYAKSAEWIRAYSH